MNTSKYIDKWLDLLYIIFFVSLVCSFRAISSIAVAVILLLSFAKNKIDNGSFFNPHLKNSFLISCCLYYLIQAILLLNSPQEASRLIELKTAIVFTPLMLCCSNYPNTHLHKKIMGHFVWILTTAMLVCLFMAFYKYTFLDAEDTVFFYHALVSPFRQHAIQVSILLFIGLIHLLESAKKGWYLFNKLIHFLLVFYFTACILLLSSKLVIAFMGISFIYYLFHFFRTNIKLRFISLLALVTGLAMITLVLITHNQVSKRFNEIIETNMDLVKQKDFNPGIYFNGLQFRLLQWRFVKEILSEKNAWLTGVSAESQKLLDEKYISTHMYTGDGKSASHGYLGYNTHNQFLESLLQSGILGLAAFILMCLAMIQLAVKRKSRKLSFVVTLLLAYSLNESLLERQYSIIIFTFFPLLFYFAISKQVRVSPDKPADP